MTADYGDTAPRGGGLSVLVVEDDPAGARSCAALLGLFGHRVRTAGDGPAAVRLRDEPPDVALIDIRLPGMDGPAVARHLARHDDPARRPLLVALTGCSAEDDVRRSRAAGFDAHIAKPVDPDALVNLLRRFERVIAPAELAGVTE